MSNFDLEKLSTKDHINLMNSFRAYYPKGINRHFMMMANVARYSSITEKDDVDSKNMWSYVKQYFKENVLNMDSVMFPNDVVEYDPFEVEELQKLRLKKKEESDKQESSNQVNDKNEISDDNTVSGPSTPVNLPASTKSKGKRYSNINDANLTPKTITEKAEVSSGRRKDRSDSEKNEKHETRNSISTKQKDREHRNEKEEKVKSEKTTGGKSASVTVKRELEKDKESTPAKKALRTSNSMMKKLRRYSPAVRDTPYKSPVSGSTKKKNTK